MLATHDASNPTVAGGDLFSEPHGGGNITQRHRLVLGVRRPCTRLAARGSRRIGNAVLAANPRWLILVEAVGDSHSDADRHADGHTDPHGHHGRLHRVAHDDQLVGRWLPGLGRGHQRQLLAGQRSDHGLDVPGRPDHRQPVQRYGHAERATVTVKYAPYNGLLAAHGSTTFGFIGTGSAPRSLTATCRTP